MSISPFLLPLLQGMMFSSPSPAIEIKPGQIFKGKVLKLFPDQMALVRIGGTQVMAKLETPLSVHEETWLQVLPQSNPIALKVVSGRQNRTGNQMGNDASPNHIKVSELLDSLGITPTKNSEEIVQYVVKNRLPLTKEMILFFRNAFQIASESKEPLSSAALRESWYKSAQIILDKNLPLTEETLKSVQMIINGPSIGSLIDKLMNAIKVLEIPSQQAADQSSSQSQQIQVMNRSQAEPQQAQVSNLSQVQSQQFPFSEQSQFIEQAIVQLRGKKPVNDGVNKLIQQLIRVLELIKGFPRMDQDNNHSAIEAIKPSESFLPQMIRKLGLAYESHVKQILFQPDAVQVPETLKGELLRLFSVLERADIHETLQPRETTQLKDAAVKLIQNLNGQQILSRNDQNHPFVNYLFQIPFSTASGEYRTLYLQMEFKKSSVGKHIDSDNCRILFFLQLDQLGDTLLDVNILNRLISIQLHTNHPMVTKVAKFFQGILSINLEKYNYRLSSMKVSSFPEEKVEEKKEMKTYQRRYRGVDIRI
ncbi:hypothetical protein L1765_10235 [Microaerobacter geothermalis]|uniref:hypothetical protein n=1 Tax=Microaerobacter geothermalis TaxID=674972 RepID=UPI001F3A2244|nr:hypothetical protein [Microaerobacter geothermalis]MCF6094341.1 hypothetical protein [Microaerobacter geothermalis]